MPTNMVTVEPQLRMRYARIKFSPEAIEMTIAGGFNGFVTNPARQGVNEFDVGLNGATGNPQDFSTLLTYCTGTHDQSLIDQGLDPWVDTLPVELGGSE